MADVRRWVLVAAVAVLLAGCGSSGDTLTESASPSSSTTTERVATTSTSTTSTSTTSTSTTPPTTSVPGAAEIEQALPELLTSYFETITVFGALNDNSAIGPAVEFAEFFFKSRNASDCVKSIGEIAPALGFMSSTWVYPDPKVGSVKVVAAVPPAEGEELLGERFEVSATVTVGMTEFTSFTVLKGLDGLIRIENFLVGGTPALDTIPAFPTVVTAYDVTFELIVSCAVMAERPIYVVGVKNNRATEITGNYITDYTSNQTGVTLDNGNRYCGVIQSECESFSPSETSAVPPGRIRSWVFAFGFADPRAGGTLSQRFDETPFPIGPLSVQIPTPPLTEGQVVVGG